MISQGTYEKVQKHTETIVSEGSIEGRKKMEQMGKEKTKGKKYK
jgi:hypothetical protein